MAGLKAIVEYSYTKYRYNKYSDKFYIKIQPKYPFISDLPKGQKYT